VKLLVDAQLPRRLAQQLGSAGHNAVPVAFLPLANRTPDDAITEIAIREARIVITKDADFVASFWLHRKPPKLLLVSTGNISNDEIWRLFAANLARLETAFAQHDFVELSRTALTIHV
jgi:predicted nuclease of predicted toxin-antitoxin system